MIAVYFRPAGVSLLSKDSVSLAKPKPTYTLLPFTHTTLRHLAEESEEGEAIAEALEAGAVSGRFPNRDVGRALRGRGERGSEVPFRRRDPVLIDRVGFEKPDSSRFFSQANSA